MKPDVNFAPAWPPNWMNASENEMRSYSGPDSELVDDGQVLRCVVKRSSDFALLFGIPFTILFVLVLWFSIQEFSQRVGFVLLSVLIAWFTFGLIYGLHLQHETRGDYIIVDRENHRILLPRHGCEFSFDQVQGLQLLTGPDMYSSDINDTDLNLFVRCADRIVRYHLMGDPNQDHAATIARAIETSLFVQRVPRGWYRCSDGRSRKP